MARLYEGIKRQTSDEVLEKGLKNLIFIDLDIPDQNMNKFPSTYATMNESGNGVHFYYKR